MKVTILGSEGQIGAYLKNYLSEKGHQVYEFDIVNGSEQDGSIIPNLDLEEKISDSDFVFFLAFDVGGSRYLAKYQHTFEFINNNTRLMANVFGYLKKYNKRFVFASSQMSNMSYSPYGVLKNVGELYTKSLNGLIVKFWNVYGVENDREKSHVITDFIRKGFEEGQFEMLTDGTEERQFLYAEDCCEALETIMNCYSDFKSTDPLHVTSFRSDSIKSVAEMIQGQFNLLELYDVKIKPGLAKDSVQLDKRNEADNYIMGWWMPKTSLDKGIAKVFKEISKEYGYNL
ncbi:MAG: NAD-dependent epimerase/dehydratase family protein [Cytophagia bacterium]|jgi:nucleoside-diphosphate-sugar epimerase|nr:NAD-dependent epimerase/dehydratase family protein [Cytophagia bacterium]